MEVQDIASNVASWLDNSTIEKLYVLGLLPSLASISKHASFWHSRVETLSGIRIDLDIEVDWKQTYQILLQLISNSSPNFWNIEDNDTVSLLLLRMNYKPQYQAMSDAVNYGSMKILRFLLNEGSINPDMFVRRSHNLLTLAIEKCHYEVVKMLLEDKRVFTTTDYSGNTEYLACRTSKREKPGDRIKIVKLILSVPHVVPDHRLFYSCSDPDIARVLIADKRIDPSTDNNMPLVQAIRHSHVGVVKVLLECPSVAQNMGLHIQQVARLSGNEEIIKLIC